MFAEARLMSITVEAVYENGVLKPSEPLPFKEHERLSLTVEPARIPIWEKIIALTADAPPEELAKPPIDGASQHDHYIYGTPKRPE
jgi:predicted DNA-binding antitoxin AbrB/MazE fold protein